MPRNVCIYCNKSYTRDAFYKRHILLCEMVNDTKRNQDINIEENDLPKYSYNDLIHVVQELKYEFVKMRQEFLEIKGKKEKKESTPKENVTPINWLTQYKENIDLENYIENMRIEEDYLNFLEEKNIYELLYILIEKKTLPLYIINNKHYFSNKNNWEECKNEDIEKYLHKIISKIWDLFLEWQKLNISKIKNDENIQKSYHLRLQNICNKNNKVKVFSKIKDNLIEKIKV